MVKVRSIQTDSVTKEAIVNLFADNKSDITNDMKIVGMIEGYKIGMGSRIMTADGDFAFMKSDGTWNWI